jgi:hypothetical protein
MYDLVADSRSADRPAFWIVYREGSVPTGNVRLLEEITPQGKKICFEISLELSDILPFPLAAAK